MRFEDGLSISGQITERFCWEILNGKLPGDGRMPSVRDTAVELQVNPNTVLKSYADLEGKGIIYKRRGLGYYVADEAHERILEWRKGDLFNRELPKVFGLLRAFDVTPDELAKQYRQFISRLEKSK